jgi:type I restriction enzyme, R subunit
MAENLEPCASLTEVRVRWAESSRRGRMIERLADRGVGFQTVAAQAGKPKAAPFDLLCHLAFNAPACPAEASERRRMLQRCQRADRMKKQQAAFFAFYAPEAREIQSLLYAA